MRHLSNDNVQKPSAGMHLSIWNLVEEHLGRKSVLFSWRDATQVQHKLISTMRVLAKCMLKYKIISEAGASACRLS